MKRLALALMAALLCATPALAYTAKSEATMRAECNARWKAQKGKVASCIAGKKGYQARMLNKAGGARKPVAAKAVKNQPVGKVVAHTPVAVKKTVKAVVKGQ